MNSSALEPIETKSAPAPVGPYSQAVLIENWLYCSGQIALDPETGEMIGNGDIEKETKQVLKNLIAVVEAAGGGTSNVIRTTIYLTDLSDFAKVNQIYSEIFNNKVSPARACVEVSNLPKGGKVEIDCVAWLGNKEKNSNITK
ncbi:RidA family protein [Prochlorococcus marinus]|uniref:Reactive intermediate/imine deaminase n=1 Tax=Prochlorococcus marinus XMU1408 TaxID=2213228 RepID=A0A318R3G3_PROMR|nr:RidA family protein [Prochlorococcus marinus]MBW3041584.1 reactive intermediate/imine deaminase [Prochlorococcus marinus str. XMU1408]PYE02740.1 reactive intermediate/imine deaminase [Prochlorococcus marinus XMU1408]